MITIIDFQPEEMTGRDGKSIKWETVTVKGAATTCIITLLSSVLAPGHEA